MEIKIISEHKKRRGRTVLSTRPPYEIIGTLGPVPGASYRPPAKGMRRVMAIVNGQTRHIDVPAV